MARTVKNSTLPQQLPPLDRLRLDAILEPNRPLWGLGEIAACLGVSIDTARRWATDPSSGMPVSKPMGRWFAERNIAAMPALPSASRNAAATGPAIDLSGARRAVFVVTTGAVAGDGDFGASLEESDDGATWGPVPDGHIQSDAPATLAANAVYRLGYLGWRRHVRLSLTKEGGTSIQIGAVAILSPLTRPA